MKLLLIVLVISVILLIIIKNDTQKHVESYEDKIRYIQSQIPPNNQSYTRKYSNHTYRGKSNISTGAKIDMSKLNEILSFDASKEIIVVEGNTPVEKIIKYLLKRGHNIQSCPDLKQLSISGLIVGVGGGNTSFSTSYFHNNVLEVDLLLPNGDIILLTPQDILFRSLPRSLGSLGYITRVMMKTIKVHPYVHCVLEHYTDSKLFFENIQKHMLRTDINFLDGNIYGPNLLILVIGKYIPALPSKKTKILNVANSRVYYEEIKKRKDIYMDTYSFIYRYETDLYYTTLSTPHFLKWRGLRKLIPKNMISFVQKIIGKLIPVEIGQFCSDTLIPTHNSSEFFDWYCDNVSVFPVYLCPVRVPEHKRLALFWPDSVDMLDFGLGYGVLPADKSKENQVRLSKKIENKMLALGGVQLPYTYTHMSEEDFWNHVGNKKLYDKIRTQYGFDKFKSIYDKLCWKEND